MGRLQQGYIYEAFNAFHVRYYVTEIVKGQPQRVQRSHRLCDKDKRDHRTKRSDAVLRACKKFMDKINDGVTVTKEDMTVIEFWDTRFLPYCEEVLPLTGLPRKKPSTVRGYKQIWNQHLLLHFGNGVTLQKYEPRMGNQLLDSLTATQGKNTLKHIKALGGSVFKRALKEQRIKVNPWTAVLIPDDAIEPKETVHYTLEEAEDMVTALVDHVDAQLVLALACFLGLGPAEIGGLQWNDIDNESIHIRRNKVRGDVVTTKNATRTASVPLIDQVRVPLELWRAKCGKDNTGDGVFVIPDLPNLINRVIKPHVSGKHNPAKLKTCVRCKILPKASSVTWKGLYAGRRGACTAVIEATGGNAGVAQRLLRHKTMDTTLRVYNKGISPQGFSDGMKLFERKVKSLSK